MRKLAFCINGNKTSMFNRSESYDLLNQILLLYWGIL